MGLDMYAYTAPKEMVGDAQVDLGDKIFADGKAKEGVNIDFAYWRKFNNLHGWMERLYRKKGGEGESFNCNTVRLDPEDLQVLETCAISNHDALEPTGGFFFGELREIDQDDKADILDFVKRAREAQAQGLVVIYDSWW